jgi:hypothetical protein
MTHARTGSEKPDDDGFFDDVVDEILGDDLPPPGPEDPWERRQRVVEATTAIILAIAAVGTAWATFQASQWSSADTDAVSASSVARNKAIQATNHARGRSSWTPRSGSSGSRRSERETRSRPSSSASDFAPVCCARTTPGSRRPSWPLTGR